MKGLAQKYFTNDPDTIRVTMPDGSKRYACHIDNEWRVVALTKADKRSDLISQFRAFIEHQLTTAGVMETEAMQVLDEMGETLNEWLEGR
jgi:rRNA processing protein Krr1/Pno1